MIYFNKGWQFFVDVHIVKWIWYVRYKYCKIYFILNNNKNFKLKLKSHRYTMQNVILVFAFCSFADLFWVKLKKLVGEKGGKHMCMFYAFSHLDI